jgi:hypothetical protein
MNKTEAVKKGVEAMKGSHNDVPKKEITLKAEDLKAMIENLTIQFNQYNAKAEEQRTMAIKTQGAIELANAQLQGLNNDTKSTD